MRHPKGVQHADRIRVRFGRHLDVSGEGRWAVVVVAMIAVAPVALGVLSR
jgi:hypothetical protein